MGQHTFNRAGWEAAPGRPAGADFEVAREFARKTLKRFTDEDAGKVGDLPEASPYAALDQMEQGMKMVMKQKPSRGGEQCSLCMDCEEQCSTSAMDAKTGEADPGKCILCLRCVSICPENALKMVDMSPMFKAVLERTKQTKEGLAEKKSRMYF